MATIESIFEIDGLARRIIEFLPFDDQAHAAACCKGMLDRVEAMAESLLADIKERLKPDSQWENRLGGQAYRALSRMTDTTLDEWSWIPNRVLLKAAQSTRLATQSTWRSADQPMSLHPYTIDRIAAGLPDGKAAVLYNTSAELYPQNNRLGVVDSQLNQACRHHVILAGWEYVEQLFCTTGGYIVLQGGLWVDQGGLGVDEHDLIGVWKWNGGYGDEGVIEHQYTRHIPAVAAMDVAPNGFVYYATPYGYAGGHDNINDDRGFFAYFHVSDEHAANVQLVKQTWCDGSELCCVKVCRNFLVVGVGEGGAEVEGIYILGIPDLQQRRFFPGSFFEHTETRDCLGVSPHSSILAVGGIFEGSEGLHAFHLQPDCTLRYSLLLQQLEVLEERILPKQIFGSKVFAECRATKTIHVFDVDAGGQCMRTIELSPSLSWSVVLLQDMIFALGHDWRSNHFEVKRYIA